MAVGEQKTNEPGSGTISPWGRGIIQPDAKGGFSAPTNIILSEAQARMLYWRDRIEHLKRIDLYARIEGLIAGNPPYNPADLKSQNLSFIANFNTLDARALYRLAALAYWNLLNQSQYLVRFVLRYDDPQAESWAEIMARNWDFVVRKWRSFIPVMGVLMGQLVKFGISPVLWPDEKDWRFRVIELNKFYIPDQAQTDLDYLTRVEVESFFTVQDLWQIYEAFEGKEDETPWLLPNLGKFLVQIANTAVKGNFNILDMMDLQRKIQNQDITFEQMFSDNVRLISLLQVEYDGKVSHYMFHRDIQVSTEGKGFLFFEDRQYDSIDEALIIFTNSPGEFTIHSNKGLGHEIFAPCQAKMMLDCSIVDSSRYAATPLIRSPATGAKDIDQIRFMPGVPTNLGQAEYVQNNFGANIQQLIGTSQYLMNMMQFNIANSGTDPSAPDKSLGSVSPSQARMMAIKEFGLTKNNIAHFYSQFDRVVQNVTVKLLRSKPGYSGYEYAKEWKERCLEEGVPKEVFAIDSYSENAGLPKKIEVYATRAAGAGSQVAHIAGLQELLPIQGTFGTREQAAYKREWISATLGPEYVKEFTQDDQNPSSGANEASVAGLENNDMTQGLSPIFSPSNDHRAHLATHLALANHTVQQIEQKQMDAVGGDKVFTNLIPHMQEHLSALEKNPFAESFVKEVKPVFDQIQKYAILNRKNAESILEAQAKKQQELQAKQQQTLSDESIKRDQMLMTEDRKNKQADITVERNAKRDERMSQNQRHKINLEAQNHAEKIHLEAANKAKSINGSFGAGNAPENPDELLAEMRGSTPNPSDIEAPKSLPPFNEGPPE